MGTITPFRYPGAKNKLIALLAPYFNFEADKTFLEPFVGGGSVALYIAEKFKDVNLVINDKDCRIFSFWKIITSGNEDNFNELLKKIDQKPTIDLFLNLRSDEKTDIITSAYKAIFFNRTCFSGILDAGPIGGISQKSKWTIDCRYNSKNLIKKVKYIRSLLINRTEVTNLDCLDFLNIYKKGLVYLDPPYYIKGDMLYSEKMNHQDHYALANALKERKKWILSYDDDEEIKKMYQFAQINEINARYSINGTKENWTKKQELIITHF